MKRLPGLVLTLGVICFMIGVSRPVILDYFGPNSSGFRLIQDNPTQWQFGNLMMGLGSILAASGAVLYFFTLRQNIDSKPLLIIAITCALSLTLAATYWMLVSYNRIVQSSLNTPKGIRLAEWTWPAFNILMPLGIVLLGYIIFLRLSKWAGMLIIAIELVSVVTQYVMMKDIIPGTHFLPLSIAGITLLLGGGRRNKPNAVTLTSASQ